MCRDKIILFCSASTEFNYLNICCCYRQLTLIHSTSFNVHVWRFFCSYIHVLGNDLCDCGMIVFNRLLVVCVYYVYVIHFIAYSQHVCQFLLSYICAVCVIMWHTIHMRLLVLCQRQNISQGTMLTVSFSRKLTFTVSTISRALLFPLELNTVNSHA